jgi:hypothetical protein
MVQAGEATDSVPRDPRRALRLHYLLRVRPRISAELDALLADLDDEFDDEFEHVDYHATHLDLDWQQRERVGRQLAAVSSVAGWRP